MSVPARDSLPPASRSLRWRLRALILGMLALIVAALLVVIYADAPRPDVSDLAFVPLAVPDDENLYLLLCAKGDALARAPLIPEDALDETVPIPAPEAVYFGGSTTPEWVQAERPELLPRLIAGEGWTPERIAQWQIHLDQLSAELREIARHTRIQGFVSRSYLYHAPSWSIRKELTPQLRLAVWAAYRGGRQSEAFERALLGLRIGRAVRKARGPISDYLNGIGIMRDFYNTLYDMATQPDLEPALLRRLIVVLDEEDDTSDGYADALRNEFSGAHEYLTKLNSQNTSGGGLDASGPLTMMARTRILFPLIYKRNLTIGLCADSAREGLGFTEYTHMRRRSGGPVTCLHCTALYEDPLKRPVNALGRFAHLQIMPVGQLIRINQSGWLLRSRRSALQAVAAVRLYRNDTGALPDELSQLVPKYLKVLPMDYVDGVPIHYSREHGAIWAGRQDGKALTHPPEDLYHDEVYYKLR